MCPADFVSRPLELSRKASPTPRVLRNLPLVRDTDQVGVLCHLSALVNDRHIAQRWPVSFRPSCVPIWPASLLIWDAALHTCCCLRPLRGLTFLAITSSPCLGVRTWTQPYYTSWLSIPSSLSHLWWYACPIDILPQHCVCWGETGPVTDSFESDR